MNEWLGGLSDWVHTVIGGAVSWGVGAVIGSVASRMADRRWEPWERRAKSLLIELVRGGRGLECGPPAWLKGDWVEKDGNGRLVLGDNRIVIDNVRGDKNTVYLDGTLKSLSDGSYTVTKVSNLEGRGTEYQFVGDGSGIVFRCNGRYRGEFIRQDQYGTMAEPEIL